MVEVATVTSKGQVTLPASIRKKLGLRKGSKLIFLEEGEGVRLLAGEDLEKRFAVFERRATEINLTPRRLSALEFLEAVFGAGELLARREYRSEIDAWRHRIRDPKDAPLAAAALVARVDGLVTGDKDLLDLERVGTIPVWRTRRVLDLLSDKL